MKLHQLLAISLALLVTCACASEGGAPSGALLDAMLKDDYGKVHELLGSGMKPNANGSPNEPVLVAFARGCGKQCEKYFDVLLERGADINITARHSGQTPLYTAVHYRKPELVRYLIKRGANVEMSDCNGETPLGVAAHADRTDLIGVLLEGGAKINAIGRSRTFSCTDKKEILGSIGMVLMGGLPHVNTGGRQGPRMRSFYYEYEIPALSYAVRMGNFKTAIYLLERGADPNVGSGEFNSTPLMFLADHCRHWKDSYLSREMAKLLMRSGAKVHTKNKAGYTAAQLAEDSRCDAYAALMKSPPSLPSPTKPISMEDWKPAEQYIKLREDDIEEFKSSNSSLGRYKANLALEFLPQQGYACEIRTFDKVPPMEAMQRRAEPILYCSSPAPATDTLCSERRVLLQIDWKNSQAERPELEKELGSRQVIDYHYRCMPRVAGDKN
jgi:ankyrin repeat protein